jgi:hypothetical protein
VELLYLEIACMNKLFRNEIFVYKFHISPYNENVFSAPITDAQTVTASCHHDIPQSGVDLPAQAAWIPQELEPTSAVTVNPTDICHSKKES